MLLPGMDSHLKHVTEELTQCGQVVRI